MRTSLLAVILWIAVLATAAPSAAQDAVAFFRQNCTSCHTVGGGRLVGPDLKGVTGRSDRAWLQQFLANPRAMIESGDPYAARLQKDAGGVVMPTIPGMTAARAAALLDMIDQESKLPRSQFAGQRTVDRPLTAADVAAGRAIFMGATRVAGGGPPCLSCHSVGNTGALGGGRLGPDLTRVYERLQGRKGLSAWLAAPATPTMQSQFAARPLQPNEVLALTAFFEDAARSGVAPDQAASLNFFLLGLGVCVLGLVGFDLAWKRRFRGVRRPLVEGTDHGSTR